MEVSSMGILAREPLAPCTSVLWGDSLSSVASRVRTGGQNIQRKGHLKLQVISGEHTAWDETSSKNAWGLQSRVPNEPQIVPPTASRHMRHALSTAPVARPTEETGSFDIWRLDGEIRELRNLMRSIQSASSFGEKMSILDSNRRVRSLFGGYRRSGLYISPVVELAMQVLSVKELYLLKCMVASGQDHILELPSDSLAALFDSQKVDQSHVSSDSQEQPSGNPVKEAFLMLANFIKSWDTSSDVPVCIAPGQWMPLMTESKPSIDTKYVKAVPGESNAVLARYSEALTYLVRMLARMEKFYDSVGGIIGYQLDSRLYLS